PSSYTLISLDINRASYPSKAPLIGMPRAFSTSKPNPEISKGLEDSLLIEKTLEKIEQDPEKVPEILESLSSNLHEKLALTLLEKNPKTLYQNLLLFTIKDEKTLIDIYLKLVNHEEFSRKDLFSCREFLIDNFKHFKFTDKDFIIKIGLSALQIKKEISESFFIDLGITDPKIIQDIFLSASKKKPDLFLSEYMQLAPHLASLNPDILEKILLSVAENLPLDYINGSRSYGHSAVGPSSLNIFVKILPHFTKESKVLDKIVGYIAEKDPKSLINTLKGLNLSEETLKLIIPKLIATVNSSGQFKKIIEELLSLELKDFDFIEDSIISLSHQNPKALIGNLASLPLPKDTLQKIIPKMIDSVTSLDSLESIAKELTALN
ncbi:MAG: hypothetical protein JSS09_06070, partial [Verrucomicrobia bacterium]|nr:hypothetical protein [Verrucomicrobiota bacterium]